MSDLIAPPPTRRSRFRPGRRGWVVLCLVVGGWFGWQVARFWAERWAVAAIQAAGGTVRYDYQFATDPAALERVRLVEEPPAPRWLRRWVGDDWFRAVASVRLPQPARADLLRRAVGLGGLIHLEVADTAGLGDDWALLRRASRLEAVDLVGPGVTDAAVAIAATLPELRSVHLRAAAVTADGLKPLARHRAIRELKLDACPNLTGAGVAAVLATGPRFLERFGWSGAPGPLFATLHALGQTHDRLRVLGFAGSPVEDGDLSALGGLDLLETLDLTGTRVTDAGLPFLRDLDRLETLLIPLPGVTDAGMPAVGQFGTLRTLDLSGSAVTDAGLADLARLTRLEHLGLGGTAATPGGIKALATTLPACSITTIINRRSRRP